MRQDSGLQMVTKTINFDYTGGKYTQNFSIRGTNLPWRYECNDSWIVVSTGAMSLTVEVGVVYDFNTRTGVVKVFDKFNNEIDLIVEQTGYYDLSVEMPANIVLYQTYYNENPSYNVYITVYGGETQMVKCKELEPYLEKVWDNSDMYNDFMLRIPQTLKGDFTVKHSDSTKFRKFCKDHGIDYPKQNLEKKLSIVQVTSEDAIGKMVVDCEGREYTNNGEVIEINVTCNKPIEINILLTEYVMVMSKTEYSVVKDSTVSVQSAPNWVDVDTRGKKIRLKCNEKNNFSDRCFLTRLENKQNTQQYIPLKITQKSGE